MDHKSVAERVLQDVGGVDNIRAAAHCATRLRLVLKTRIPLIKVLLTMTKTLKAVS